MDAHIIDRFWKDLAVIDELEILNSLFKRPEDFTDFNSFKMKLALPVKSAVDRISPVAESLEHILWALYEKPTDPIVASKGNAEKIILTLWSQQWPRLRRNFRFCSLSFAG